MLFDKARVGNESRLRKMSMYIDVFLDAVLEVHSAYWGLLKGHVFIYVFIYYPEIQLLYAIVNISKHDLCVLLFWLASKMKCPAIFHL